MTRLLLFTTQGCHLCEHAAEMLAAMQAQGLIAVEAVEISADAALVERYGIRIPVVMNPVSAEELGWPFTPADLLRLV